MVGMTKTEAGSGRPMPPTPTAWLVLDMWALRFPNRKPADHFFPACKNGHVNPCRPVDHGLTAKHKACTLAGLSGVRYHDLRYTAATKMLEKGAPISTMARVLGWSASTTIRKAERYGHIWPKAQRRVWRALPRLFQW